MKLRPVHSTWLVTRTLVDTLLAHMMHVRVFTEKTFPLGTSGVRVVVIVETYSSKSQWAVSSRNSHRVCLGPMLALRGLMYDMLRASNAGLSGKGIQSDI